MDDSTVGAAARMARAADDLLAALDPSQLDAACFDFDDTERGQWFFTPTDHGGLALTEMSSVQHRLVHRLVASGLSGPGYVTAATILGQENVLDHLEGFRIDFGRERGRDPLLYWIAVFGKPGDERWSWRFGGHHLSLNFTVVGGDLVATTPCFMGADPASAPLLGPHLHRPLGGAEDLGRELAESMTNDQATAALLPIPPVDIVGANRTRLAEGDRPLPLPVVWRGRFEKAIDEMLGRLQRETEASLGLTEAHVADLAFTHRPKGVPGHELSADQRRRLLDLLGTYIGRIADDVAERQLERVERSLDELHFLWAGDLEPGRPHYYRIQGGGLLVEYDNAQRAGNHVHTVWRDLERDFGMDPLAEHHAYEHGAES